MSGQQWGTVIGGIIGSFIPVIGTALGAAIGGFIGGVIDPTKIDGPRIGDGQQQAATDGNPIAWVMGTATVAGTIVQVGERRDVKVKDSGKGGPEVSHHEARQDFAILICESSETRNSTMSKVLMVEQDGKIVYDIRSGEGVDRGIIGDPSKYVVRVVNAMLNAAKWSRNISFVYGAEDQLPHPTLEAITGVGNTPSYRGQLMMIAKDFNVTAAGDRIPSFRFTVASEADVVEANAKAIFYEWAQRILDPPLESAGDYAFIARMGRPFNIYEGLTPPSSLTLLHFVDASLPVNDYDGYAIRYVIRNSVTNAIILDTGWSCSDPYYVLLSNYYHDTQGGPIPTIDMRRGDFSRAIKIEDETDNSHSYYRVMGNITVGTNNTDLVVDMYSCGTGSIFDNDDRLGQLTLGVISSQSPITTYTPGSLTLAEVITRIVVRGGLTADDIDVSELTDVQVLGYPIARQADAISCIDPLLAAFFCYRSEYDGKIYFKKFGADAVMSVDEDDLVQAASINDDPVESTRRSISTVFPRKITVKYMDVAQNYMPVTVSEERTAVDVTAIGETVISVPVVMAADTAKQIAQKAMKVAYATLEGTNKYSLPFARGSNCYLKVCAGECVMFRGKRWLVTGNVIGNGYMKLDTRFDRKSAYVSAGKAVKGNAPMPPTSRVYSGDTTLVAFNAPSLRQQDTLGLYIGAGSPTGDDSWIGCQVQVSYDNQTSWVNAMEIRQATVMGTVIETEPTSGEPITVKVNGDLFSVTDEQLDARANGFAMIHGTGTVEIGQFRTATEDESVAGVYSLTGVARGQLGTARSTATVNDTFAMLDNVYFLPISDEFKGKTIYLRGVGFGELAEEADIIAVTFEAIPPYEIQYRVDVDGNYRVDVDGNRRKTR
jgi:hypothetical protein